MRPPAPAQLQHEPDDGQRLPDVAEGHRQRVHQVREHHRCQATGCQIQPEVLAFHAEEEHVAESHDERLGEAYQAEHPVSAEIQLAGRGARPNFFARAAWRAGETVTLMRATMKMAPIHRAREV